MEVAVMDRQDEFLTAIVPRGTRDLADYLVDLVQDDARFRPDDYHAAMAVAILINPQPLLDILGAGPINQAVDGTASGPMAPTMGMYRKKPVVIEARCNDAAGYREDENGTYGAVYSLAGWCGGHVETGGFIVVPTLEGEMTASPGDWIIKGVKGEFYPVKNEIFEATYEPA